MPAQRYRPEAWDEVVGQPTEEIRALIDGRDTPNFLLYGPPGTGKTTVARLVAAEIQGSADELKALDSSDDRGIDAVREQINPIVHQTTLTGAPVVVFLDEMDSMTKEAQQALRRPMEQGNAVFVLACNDVSAVHDAVRSRCHDYEFDALSDAAIKERVRQVADAEGVDLSDDHLKSIVSFANGDMRSAIQKYTAFARGAFTDEQTTINTDSRAYEREAREFLDGDA